ncbi:hypothetical protein SprV_0301141400 [Sparganum proliferum]
MTTPDLGEGDGKSQLTGGPLKDFSTTCNVKRTDYLSWDEYFMSLAFLSAMRSKDPITQEVVYFSEKKVSKPQNDAAKIMFAKAGVKTTPFSRTGRTVAINLS